MKFNETTYASNANLYNPENTTREGSIYLFQYNENDVYVLETMYGYQSNIEFGRGEEIETLSVGDQVAWQIVPAGRRLFIRPMEPRAHTNMTVVTNRRAYQFDLVANQPDSPAAVSKIAYVIRFYYPEGSAGYPVPEVTPQALLAATAPRSAYNYNYTYEGDEKLAPLKIYDDGSATYFRLPPGKKDPEISMVNGDDLTPLKISITPEGYRSVPVVAKSLVLEYEGGQKLRVFNER